jgi:uncharacterized protein (DUF1330 family)
MGLSRFGLVAAFAAVIALPLLAQENRPWSLADIPGACNAPVLMVVQGDLSPEGFAPRQGRPGYGQALRASGSYERFDGWYVASGAPAEVFEGAWRPNQDMLQIAEFPCLEAARGWYYSTDYQATLPLRARAGEFRLAVWPKRAKEGMNWVSDRAARQARAPAAAGERRVTYTCSDGQNRAVTYVGAARRLQERVSKPNRWWRRP